MYALSRITVSGRILGVSTLLVVSTGCTDGDPWLSSVAAVDIESPAAPSSGEPFLSRTGDAVYMSWLEQASEDTVALRMARYGGDGWSTPNTIAASASFFVNWADFPSVRADESGVLWAHWLQRDGRGSLDYSVLIVRSSDGGESWSDPWKLHEDTAVIDHGFVSAIPIEGGLGFAWLDGRNNIGGSHGAGSEAADPTRAMNLRYREVTAGGEPGPEILVDDRVCDCCQTDAVLTPSGAIVVYRNRTVDEIRDIYITRLVDGSWTDGAAVNDDGWHIGGCPVNGPAAVMIDDVLAVTWFTMANDVPHVKVAFSHDDGASFGPPVIVDDGNPEGRVDVVALPDGRAGVTWLERTGGAGAEVRLRAVAVDGNATASFTVSESRSARASGFARTVVTPSGDLLVAWTDATEEPARVRVTKVQMGDR